DRGAKERDSDEWKTNARDADAVGTQGRQLIIGGEPAENEEDGGEQSPGNGKDERERQDVGDEANQVIDGQIVINEKRQEFSKDVADDENETENEDRKEQTHDELPA